MPSFGTVALPDINPLFDLASVDRNVNAINGGRLTNQLASNTLDSNTKIAANTAESGSLANQYASQRNPLEISLLRQQTGAEPSPVFDKLQQLYNGGGAAPAGDGSAPQGQSLLNGPMPVSADPQTQQDVGAEARAQGVNPDWAMRVHSAESGASKEPFGPGSTSSAGAIGPMQLMPDTAKGLGVDPNSYSGNIKGGVTYLGQMKARYVSPVLATAAYNAGPGRVDDFLAGKSGLPPETIAYVGKVFGTDGASILNAAMSGAHGHVIPGVAAPAAQTSAAAPPAQPGVTLAPDGTPAPAPVQTATRGPMPGDTANDGTSAPAPGFGPDGQPLSPGTWNASPVAAAPQAAPMGQGVSDVMARLRNAPQVQNPNSLLDVAAPDGSVPTAPQNALAQAPVPVQPAATPPAPPPIAPSQPAPPAAQPATGMNSPQVQQAQDLMRRATQIEIAAAATPNDPRAKAAAAAMAADLRARASVIMNTDSVVVQKDGTQLHPITGKVDSAATPAMNYQPDPNNPGVLISPGNKPVVLPPGRATTLPDGSTWVTGPGGTFKEVREANLEGASAASAAAAGGKQAAESAAKTKDALIPLARTSIQAISNIDYGLHQLDEAAKGGIPTGYFAPALATAAAAAKSIGVKIPGVDPAAVSDIQTASKTLAVVSGAILQNIIGKGEITDGKIEAFIHAQPGIVNDPQATHRILNWARSQFTYDHEMAMDGLAAVDPKSGQLAPGWQAGYITKHGAGPIFDSASGEMKQPDGQGPSREPPVEAAKPAPPPAAAAPQTPSVGTVMQGHRFLGGDPSKPASWQAVQ